MIFWHNLFRYPRFFISSMIGLILIIVTPILNIIKNNFKNRKFILFLSSCALFILIIVAWVLSQMLSID